MIELKIEQANVIRKALRQYMNEVQSRDEDLNLDCAADLAVHHDNQKEYDLITEALSFL